jgi:hypothetical protein
MQPELQVLRLDTIARIEVSELADDRQQLLRDRRRLARAVAELREVLRSVDGILEELSGRPATMFVDRSAWLGGGEPECSPGSSS